MACGRRVPRACTNVALSCRARGWQIRIAFVLFLCVDLYSGRALAGKRKRNCALARVTTIKHFAGASGRPRSQSCRYNRGRNGTRSDAHAPRSPMVRAGASSPCDPFLSADSGGVLHVSKTATAWPLTTHQPYAARRRGRTTERTCQGQRRSTRRRRPSTCSSPSRRGT